MQWSCPFHCHPLPLLRFFLHPSLPGLNPSPQALLYNPHLPHLLIPLLSSLTSLFPGSTYVPKKTGKLGARWETWSTSMPTLPWRAESETSQAPRPSSQTPTCPSAGKHRLWVAASWSTMTRHQFTAVTGWLALPSVDNTDTRWFVIGPNTSQKIDPCLNLATPTGRCKGMVWQWGASSRWGQVGRLFISSDFVTLLSSHLYAFIHNKYSPGLNLFKTQEWA